MKGDIKILNSFTFRAAIVLLALVLFTFSVIKARNFLYPITLGFLLAYLLFPLANLLEKNKFPRILSIIISIIVGVVIIGSVVMFFYSQLTILFDDFESLKKSANRNIETLQHTLSETFGITDNRVEVFLKKQVSTFFQFSNQSLQKLFSSTTGTIFRIGILPVYVFLFLYYRTKFAYFILKKVSKKHERLALNILRDISTVAAKYMGGVSIVVFILCILNSTGLMIIGVKYAILLGIISAIFNFIPYFGTLMGGAVPLLFVLLTSADPSTMAIRVVVLFVIIQFTENNILTPNIVGGYVDINPFFIIVGLIAGGMIWGIPGMLIVVPMLAIARIIFRNIPELEAYAFLLGPRGTQQHALSFKNIKKLVKYLKPNK
ncbi:MAG: AI-2E family transporter [Bacteroidetes bacterium]|jgi:predicted PurR-regulated permease PerM|nr:AI-2E family transporter [Bacteroidota bacterium]